MKILPRFRLQTNNNSVSAATRDSNIESIEMLGIFSFDYFFTLLSINVSLVFPASIRAVYGGELTLLLLNHLSAPQSGALRTGAYRDFQHIPSNHPLLALSL